jgi:2-amino-4-hydroxy-6-hydroxymethyldihydropteridine diphosphokinase
MPNTLISLGANLGEARESMRAARRMLDEVFGANHIRSSSLYRTPPVGGPSGQSDFLNAVVAIDTELSVWGVWETIKRIEKSLGRQRLHRWEARRIDIDLILYGQDRVWTPHLKVPHPRMCMRTFVVKPAIEIVPAWVDPVTRWSMAQLGAHLTRQSATPLPFRIVCSDAHVLREFQFLFESQQLDSAPARSPLRVTWQDHMGSSRNSVEQFALTIAAVASPDPMSILWEDYSMNWVQKLGLTASQHELDLIGPRYLMPANDMGWALHELTAASQAMTCNIEILGAF